MNRRNLFKLLAGAACAAAIELGMKPLLPRLAAFDAKAYMGDMVWQSVEARQILASTRRSIGKSETAWRCEAIKYFVE